MEKDVVTGKEIKNEHKICLSHPFSDRHIMPGLK
jgi:hypothetical protein